MSGMSVSIKNPAKNQYLEAGTEDRDANFGESNRFNHLTRMESVAD